MLARLVTTRRGVGMAADGHRAVVLLVSALLIAVLGLLVLANPAYASTYTVNSFGDDPDTTPGDDDCTDLIRRLEALGNTVTLIPKDLAA